MNFIVHGEIKLSVEPNLLVVDCRGPWNIDSINQSTQTIDESFDTLYQSTWGALVLAKGDSIMMLDAKERLIEIVKADRQQGRVATAIVISDCDSPILVEDHLGDVYRQAGDEFAFFKKQSDARAWLKQQVNSHLQGCN